MGFVTVLAFVIGVLFATVVWMWHIQRMTVDWANANQEFLYTIQAQLVEAEERGRWQVTMTMDAMFAKFAATTSTSESERAQVIPLTQPTLEPPHELLLAYGVSRVEELPDPLRAVWDKNYTGGES